MIDTIGFDADDTLWHNETLYLTAQQKFQEILSPFCEPDQILQELYKTEMQNLHRYGYGIKSFTLSMIETAIKLSKSSVPATEIDEILGVGWEMLSAPVQLLEGVTDVLAALSPAYELVLITKGDLFDQELKVARSGLESYFAHVEVVRDKTPEIYRSVLARHQIAPERFLMVGNSLRSDVMPLVTLGARAVHIPYDVTWEHEEVESGPDPSARYVQLEQIGLLPDYVRDLAKTQRNPSA
ncbi:HAD family hydrolase [Chloroflexota bacterium]